MVRGFKGIITIEMKKSINITDIQVNSLKIYDFLLILIPNKSLTFGGKLSLKYEQNELSPRQ